MENETSWESWFRRYLALIVTAFAIVGTCGLGITGVIMAGKIAEPEKAFVGIKDVIGMILPVMGAWIGTVLAFYFGRENFESAAKNTRDLVGQLTSDEKLRSVPAGSAMIPIGAADTFTLPTTGAGDVLLQSLLALLKTKNRNRLPILDGQGRILYIAHRSTIDRFVVNALQGNPPPEIATLTLAVMLASPEFNATLTSGLGTVRETDSLAEAKTQMDRVPNCLDVFVTADGTRNSAVLGWLTNVIVLEQSRV